jgi:hypothetical protein
MVTPGDISLDVEDNRSPYDWPLVEDLSINMLKYSVHLPCVPQNEVWPMMMMETTSSTTPPSTQHGEEEQVVRF